jgi:type IX secretion system PorP/SprF family membrane protein
VGGNLLNLDFAGLQNFDNEPVSGDNIENKFSPNFGLGLYYHSNTFYAGLSAPNLLQTEHFDNSQRDANSVQFLSKERINFYFITGYVIDIGRNDNVKFKPALLTKVVGGAPLQLDLSTSFLFSEKFTIGAAYRWDAALSAMAGFQITDQLMLGLAYDKETTELGGTQFNDGSFEVFLRFELLKSFQRTISPRFF